MMILLSNFATINGVTLTDRTCPGSKGAYTWSQNLAGRCSRSCEGRPCLHGHEKAPMDGR